MPVSGTVQADVTLLKKCNNNEQLIINLATAQDGILFPRLHKDTKPLSFTKVLLLLSVLAPSWQILCLFSLLMNYLAHAYLSFNNPEMLVGNMISDFVKGKKKFDYPAGIQKGITLHRAIDEFTDTHPATKTAKEFFRPAYRLYSGAFVDVVYDHFLALDTNEFPNSNALENFSQGIYQTLEENFSFLPFPFQNFFPLMRKHNWLFNYQYKIGIEKSFMGLVYRAKYISESAVAFAVFNEHYKYLKESYNIFFPDLKKFAFHI